MHEVRVHSEEIPADAPWYETGIRLEAGREYRFTATGTWSDWRQKPCGPEGFPSANWIFRSTAWMRRVRDQPWMKLMGAIDRDTGTLLTIGSGGILVPTATGELTCFANDLPGMHFNNSGSIHLEVTPLA